MNRAVFTCVVLAGALFFGRLEAGAALVLPQPTPTPSPPATTPPPIIYLVSADSSSSTNSQSTNVNSVYASATEVANAFDLSAIRLGATFDPSAPEKLCQDSRTQALVRPQDMLLVFSIGRADQVSNKFTGGESESVSVNFTRIICPAIQQTANPSAQPNASVSAYWGPSTSGAYSHYYWFNPISGIASVAALLTSPWVNTYRLWLTVPGTVVDSFKNQQSSMSGTIYCATTDAVLEMLVTGNLIAFQNTNAGLYAYRMDTINLTNGKPTPLRVPGVNRCKEPQPVRPRIEEEAPKPPS